MLDPSLGDNYDHEEMEKMVLAAILCIKCAPRARPQMNLLLQGDTETMKWASVEQGLTLEEYLRGRCSRASSFN
ncbi:hypothetical protein ACSQ67_004193 [Phaseolus vulgaris]